MREAQTRAATATSAGAKVESRLEPNVETAWAQPTARSGTRPTESGIEAKPPQRLSERGQQQLFAASGRETTCFPSASAVLLNYPGARPSWTLKAPGHEGTRCWFAAGPTPLAKDKGSTVENQTERQGQAASLQPVVPLDPKPTGSGIEARSPQALPERGKQPFAAIGHDASCFPSASAVRQAHPGAWPSWTSKAPGYEGVRCWYPAMRTTTSPIGLDPG